MKSDYSGEGPMALMGKRWTFVLIPHLIDGVLESYDPSYGGWFFLKDASVVYEEGDIDKSGPYQRSAKCKDGRFIFQQSNLIGVRVSKLPQPK